MKVWNQKYDIDHEELEEKISTLAEELDLLRYEIESELDDLKFQHEDWDIDKLFDEIKRIHLEK